ncbi:S-4TM family putative pore-forming effector [uncultured Pantoea sp.]|uniref:S-4TM family putative pore-forming effector n=1 Tax=uncultured Pantoea sp. TaxID=218084 RepID=UPI0027D93DAE|nr:S-4TM family putative pore-forming effector [uncultured Pantoea sp.]
MSQLFARQNEEHNIFRQMAVRRLYSKAKFVNMTNFVFSAVIPVVLAVLAVIFRRTDFVTGQKIAPYFGYYGIAILLFTLLTGGLVTLIKKKAATIQEMYDCDLYGIAWNELKCGTRLSREEVFRAARYYIKRPKHKHLFTDWYTKKDYALPELVLALMCQGENIGWDLSQRRILKRFLWSILITSFVLLLAYGLYSGVRLDNFLYYIVFLLPLFRHFILQLNENVRTLARSEKVKSFIEKKLHELKEKPVADELKLAENVRMIQDEIFSHRASSSPVPDFLHGWYRRFNEEVAQDSFDDLFRELKDVRLS